MLSNIVNLDQRKRIIAFLLASGIPAHRKGFVYLCDAIEAVADNPFAIHLVTKTLYLDIARRHNTNIRCVERAIGRVIGKAWEGGGIELSRVPSNSVYISMVAQQMTDWA